MQNKILNNPQILVEKTREFFLSKKVLSISTFRGDNFEFTFGRKLTMEEIRNLQREFISYLGISDITEVNYNDFCRANNKNELNDSLMNKLWRENGVAISLQNPAFNTIALFGQNVSTVTKSGGYINLAKLLRAIELNERLKEVEWI